ncbi:MAG TPA: BON domain-containing protein [Pyrinomonadaceae bacterium]|nr:BON domain-containing protein [Pyrinomonadaceae bacterium]
MSYDDQESRRSRVVVETPNTRREVTHTEAVRGDRDGISGATVGVIVVVAIALVTILILFLMSGQTDTANDNLALQQQQPVQPSTTIVQQPAAQQPPVIIQQAPPATQQAPIIVTQPASGGATTEPDDSTIQSEIDKRILDDPNLSTLGVTVSVLSGKATLIGTVKSEAIKSQFERLVRAVKGVKDVDNQILVSA